ncbi:MAG TPA: ATP phosphoribosyltransferase [Candidatus Dormibacteraeota bacterium]|nr:ATP phosphoribosyltransferase [Candidatus Dormibacteraeota bacterium]
MKSVISEVGKAKLILVPKGDDSVPCLQAFQKAIGIAVPEFVGRKLEVKAGRRTFLKVKGRDIPRLIAAGYGDVGLTGSDSCEEYISSLKTASVAYQAFGPSMCRFALLAPLETAAATRRRLKNKTLGTPVATSFPNLLRKCAIGSDLSLAVTDIAVLGSVEIMPRLLNVPLVADLVSSGSTAAANGLVEIATLMDVYPAVVTRDNRRPKPPKPLSAAAIGRIDTTLARRSLQLDDRSVTSPTLELLRDPNLAGKKAGEEFAETLMAIFGNGTVAECESELADLIYAQLVAARSRNKPVELGNVIRVLVGRNQRKARS